MKVLICGGRDFDDRLFFKQILDNLPQKDEIEQIIHGAAPGADTFAETWAAFNSIPTRRFPALWKTYGKSAGFIRNKQMLDEGKPDLVIAFPTGGPGTNNMIDISRKFNIPVLIFQKG